MEEPRDNPRRPSNQSGVYEQPYGSNGIYNKYFDPYFRDDTNDLDPYFIFLVRDPRGLMNSRLRIARVQYHEKDEKNGKSVNDSSFIEYNLYSSV